MPYPNVRRKPGTQSHGYSVRSQSCSCRKNPKHPLVIAKTFLRPQVLMPLLARPLSPRHMLARRSRLPYPIRTSLQTRTACRLLRLSASCQDPPSRWYDPTARVRHRAGAVSRLPTRRLPGLTLLKCCRTTVIGSLCPTAGLSWHWRSVVSDDS